MNRTMRGTKRVFQDIGMRTIFHQLQGFQAIIDRECLWNRNFQTGGRVASRIVGLLRSEAPHLQDIIWALAFPGVLAPRLVVQSMSIGMI